MDDHTKQAREISKAVDVKFQFKHENLKEALKKYPPSRRTQEENDMLVEGLTMT